MDVYEDQRQAQEDQEMLTLELLEIIQSIEEADRAALVPLFA